MNLTFRRFGDCLLLGVFTAVAAVPVITAYPALVAACTMLRDDEPVGPVSYARRLFRTLRAAWLPALVFPLLLLDVAALRMGVPGAWALSAVLAVVAVIGLRGAAAWRPGVRWASVAREAWRDPSGSVLMALAGACAAVIVALVPMTALLVGGPLANALVAVEGRKRGG